MPIVEFEKETIGSALMTKKQSVRSNQSTLLPMEKEHVEDLYSDLNGAIENGHEEYFLGAVIVVVHKGKGDCIKGGGDHMTGSAIARCFRKSGCHSRNRSSIRLLRTAQRTCNKR